jgi:hypothetical protein
MCNPKTVRLVSQLLYNFKSFGFYLNTAGLNLGIKKALRAFGNDNGYFTSPNSSILLTPMIIVLPPSMMIRLGKVGFQTRLYLL